MINVIPDRTIVYLQAPRRAPFQEVLLEHLVSAQHTRPRVPDEREHKEIVPNMTIDVFVCS